MLHLIIKCDFLFITELILAFVYAEIYDEENFFLVKSITKMQKCTNFRKQWKC